MGSDTITPTADQSAPDSFNVGSRFVAPALETYAQITAGVGTHSGFASLPTQPHVYLIKSNGDQYSHSKLGLISLDLRELAMVSFTAASITARINDVNYTAGDAMWQGVSDYDSVVVSGTNEDVIGVNWSQSVNYREICQGFGVIGDYSNRIGMGSFTAGVNSTWTLDASGLAYLNSVANKTYNPGYAFLSLVFGGQSSGVAPTVTNARRQDISLDWATAGYVSLTFTSNIKINVGDVWKDVVSIEVNRTGTTWDYVVDLDLNVGDVWKDMR
jgi:hypothetical protein